MKKEISISIDPCSENPEKMIKTENGKFCFACSKNVIDFTQMTDNEIIQYVSKNSENQCGKSNFKEIEKSDSSKKVVKGKVIDFESRKNELRFGDCEKF